MALETTLSDITAKLRQGKFPNEQSISQTECCTSGASCHGSRFRGNRSLRVLQELGWVIPYSKLRGIGGLRHSHTYEYVPALEAVATWFHNQPVNLAK